MPGYAVVTQVAAATTTVNGQLTGRMKFEWGELANDHWPVSFLGFPG
jgi:hypothetical protein